jgi:hypothetical protein
MILITDTNNETLESEISELVGTPYLREATKDEADKVAEEIRGFAHGWKRRQILPCVLGIPLTYISSQISVHPTQKECPSH